MKPTVKFNEEDKTVLHEDDEFNDSGILSNTITLAESLALDFSRRMRPSIQIIVPMMEGIVDDVCYFGGKVIIISL